MTRTSGEADGLGIPEPPRGCIALLSSRYLDSGCKAAIFALSPAYREAGENTKSCTERGRLPTRSKCTTHRAFAAAYQRSNWTVSRKECQRFLCSTMVVHTASASFSVAPQAKPESSPQPVESKQLTREKSGGTRFYCADLLSPRWLNLQCSARATTILKYSQVVKVFEVKTAASFGIREGDILLSIHCGSRGLGHQIGTEFLKQMAIAATSLGIDFPDRELAYAPINSEVGESYLGAMRAAINCALANREIITHLVRQAFAERLRSQRGLSVWFPNSALRKRGLL